MGHVDARVAPVCTQDGGVQAVGSRAPFTSWPSSGSRHSPATRQVCPDTHPNVGFGLTGRFRAPSPSPRPPSLAIAPDLGLPCVPECPLSGSIQPGFKSGHTHEITVNSQFTFSSYEQTCSDQFINNGFAKCRFPHNIFPAITSSDCPILGHCAGHTVRGVPSQCVDVLDQSIASNGLDGPA